MNNDNKDVHTEHCCVLHGCKYGDEPFCPVVNGQKEQSFVCESCDRDGIRSLAMLQAVREGRQKRCSHCGHTL